jgi:hypothetical protein
MEKNGAQNSPRTTCHVDELLASGEERLNQSAFIDQDNRALFMLIRVFLSIQRALP